MKNKRPYYYLGLIAIILIIAISPFYYNQKKASPQAEYYDDPNTTVIFENSIFDIGDVSNDTIIDCTYRFKNTGEVPLIIYYVDSGCFCTGYSMSDKMIMPDKTGEITLSLDTDKKSPGAFFMPFCE